MILRIIKNSWLLIGATICFSLFMCGIGSLNAYYSEGDRTFASSHWSKLVNPDSKYIIELAKGKTIDEIVEFVYTKRRTVPTDDNLPAECFAKQIMESGYYEGDCLSSALLVVSMARSIGIPPDKIRVILFARHASPQIKQDGKWKNLDFCCADGAELAFNDVFEWRNIERSYSFLG